MFHRPLQPCQTGLPSCTLHLLQVRGVMNITITCFIVLSSLAKRIFQHAHFIFSRYVESTSPLIWYCHTYLPPFTLLQLQVRGDSNTYFSSSFFALSSPTKLIFHCAISYSSCVWSLHHHEFGITKLFLHHAHFISSRYGSHKHLLQFLILRALQPN